MENRSHALAAGIFTLLLLLGAIATVFWLQRDQTDLVPYDLVTYDSVQGLSPQAAVRYRGLPVGKVDRIGFAPDGSGAMLIRIGVRPNTPMTDKLTATVEMQGITGIAYIDLDDDGKPGRPLASSDEKVARIQMQPGLAERLMTRGKQLIDSLERVGSELQQMLGPENRAAINTILANAAAASEEMRQVLAALEPIAREAEPAMRQLGAAASEAGRAAGQIADLAGDARQTLRQLMSPNGIMAEAGRSLEQLQRAVASFGGMAPQLSELTEDAGATVQSARRTLETFERAPQSLLFGAPKPRPGPGEPGFSGFRQRQ